MRRTRRTRLAAACLLLLPFAVPAAAQAHHTTLTASCVVEGAAPVVEYRVQYVGFSAANAKTSITGTVKVDGATARAVPPANLVSWSGTTGTLAGSVPGVPGERSTVVSKFKWLEGTAWHDEPARTVETAPAPIRGSRSTRTARRPPTPATGRRSRTPCRNTGNVTLSSPEVTDDKCAPVTKVPDGQGSFDPGDAGPTPAPRRSPRTWATRSSTSARRARRGGIPTGRIPEVCDDDTHTTEIPRPAVRSTRPARRPPRRARRSRTRSRRPTPATSRSPASSSTTRGARPRWRASSRASPTRPSTRATRGTTRAR